MKPRSSGYLSEEIRISRLRDILTLLPILSGILFGLPIFIGFGALKIFGNIPVNFLVIFAAWIVLIFIIWLTNHLLSRALENRGQ